MERDGKLHVKTMAEANKYMKPIKDKALEEVIGISAVGRLDKLEKQIEKLQKKITGLETQNLNLVGKVLLMELTLNKLVITPPHKCGGNSLTLPFVC